MHRVLGQGWGGKRESGGEFVGRREVLGEAEVPAAVGWDREFLNPPKSKEPVYHWADRLRTGRVRKV